MKRLMISCIGDDMKVINVNSMVRVKLTNYGRDIYYHQYDETNERFPSAFIAPSYPKTEDGYLKDQLWSVMHIFGKYLALGARRPFDADIVIDDDLVEEFEYEGK